MLTSCLLERPLQLCAQAVVLGAQRPGCLCRSALELSTGVARSVSTTAPFFPVDSIAFPSRYVEKELCPPSLLLGRPPNADAVWFHIPFRPGQISASLTSLSRTIDDYHALARRELIPEKQQKAFERVKNFRADLVDYRERLDRLKKDREQNVGPASSYGWPSGVQVSTSGYK